VTDIVQFGSEWTDKLILRIAAAVERQSEHPLAAAVVRAAEARGQTLPIASAFTALVGKGVRAMVEGRSVLLGNRALFAAEGVAASLPPQIESLETDGKTVLLLAVDGSLAGAIAVADPVKETSREAIARLRARGLAVVMLTGDNVRTARAIARSVGITSVRAEVLPEQKSAQVRRLQEVGAIVAMVGDGINDSPALAQADLGIAMGSGTDIAMESAGIVLMKSDLRDVESAIALSRGTVGKIQQNLFFALFYNVLGIPIAAGVFSRFGMTLRPELAGLAMALSSVSVVTNALLLRGFQPQRRNVLSTVAPILMAALFLVFFLYVSRLSAVLHP